MVIACSADPPAPVIQDVVLACPPAEPEGLAVRVWAPSSGRYAGIAPILLRQGGAGSVGWDLGHDPAGATARGFVVVQYLRPGTADDGVASGGVDTFGGADAVASLGCVSAWLDGGPARSGGLFSDLVPDPGVRIATGLSVGGNLVLLAWDAGLLRADAVVLWESPLVDQLVLEEPTVDGALDPLFVPGSCTLDAGCPFPGRPAQLGYDPERLSLFRDLDGDGVFSEGDVPYDGLHVRRDDGVPFYSAELATEAETSVFVSPPPAWWPTAEQREAFWAGWDATGPLQRIRSEGTQTPFLFLARGIDHVQLVHDHVAIADQALAGASFFRLNPDAAYLEAYGEASASDSPAGAAHPYDVLSSLPDPDLHALVLAGETELADRATLDRWEADLDAPLWPVAAR